MNEGDSSVSAPERRDIAEGNDSASAPEQSGSSERSPGASPAPQERSIISQIEPAAVVLLPVGFLIYLVFAVAQARFYGVFGLTLDQVGVDQVTLLIRLAFLMFILTIFLFLFMVVLVAVGRLLSLLSSRRLGRLGRGPWRQRCVPPVVVGLFAGVMLGLLYVVTLAGTAAAQGDFDSVSESFWVLTGPAALIYVGIYALFMPLRSSRHFRAVTAFGALAAVILAAGSTFIQAADSAATKLHETGRFSGELDFLGIVPQVVTVRFEGGKPLVPEDRVLFLLAQRDDVLWLYDCTQKRTIRTTPSGSGVIVTSAKVKNMLDEFFVDTPGEIRLTC